MATIGDLITIVREDYLYDVVFPYRWSDAFMLRNFLEAEKQACSRWNLIYDNSTASIAQIALKNGTASYALSTKITALEKVLLDGVEVIKRSKAEIERLIPTWRTDTGITNKTLYYVIKGRTLYLTPIPTASLDATFIQDTEPSSGMVANDTWWDTTNSLLYKYSSGSWSVDATATLNTLDLECFRLPTATSFTTASTPEIPDEFHEGLIHWVLYRAYMKKDADGVEHTSYDPKQALLHLEMFDSIFGKPVSAAVRQNQLEENPVLCLRPVAYSKTSSTDEDEDW